MSPSPGVKLDLGSQQLQPLPSLRGREPPQEAPLCPNMAAAASSRLGGPDRGCFLAVTAPAVGRERTGRGGQGMKSCWHGSDLPVLKVLVGQCTCTSHKCCFQSRIQNCLKNTIVK